ncbi:MAG TPA: collagen-like protein [Flavobacteriaceae bacterium]|nr:collagen-like protein [Flavobacteriaceae bacterium]
MKKLFILFALPLFMFTACEGPQGPPGFDGINILGQTFEFDNVNFTYDPQFNYYSRVLTIPSNIEVWESDAILVYRLEKVVNAGGSTADSWSLIPHNFFFNNGEIIQYVYNHTFFDVELIIEGNFNLANLDPAYTQNQVFRFVVVPSDFGIRSGVDISDYDAVMKAIEIKD